MLIDRPNDKYYRWNPDTECYEFWSRLMECWMPEPLIQSIEQGRKHNFVSYEDSWAEPYYGM